jgi:hypothetical protein
MDPNEGTVPFSEAPTQRQPSVIFPNKCVIDSPGDPRFALIRGLVLGGVIEAGICFAGLIGWSWWKLIR